MDRNIHMYLMVLSLQILVIAAQTNNQDYAILQSVRQEWENTPPSWDSSDPCGDWVGIGCTNSRVTTIILVSMSLTGRLSGDIPNLSELEILDLSYNIDLTGPLPPSIGNLKKLVRLNLVNCGFTGLIPDEIGSLPQLASLSLNNNSFSGRIPPSIGSLSNLYWLDLADNQLRGTIPVSNGTIPGLDLLLNTTHFHFGNNQLTGEIPSQLFSSNMRLIHLLFENNELTGNIPSTLGLVQTLEVVRLDRNSLSGRIPSNLNNLTRVSELYLYNNRLIGPLPDFTDMDYLNHLDMSNNTFDASEVPPWFSTLESLTTLMLENTQLQGQVPVALFSLPQLRTLGLRNNQLNGTLDIGSSYTNQLQVVNLQNNSISDFTQRNGYDIGSIILVGNPICEESRGGEYCIIPEQSNPSNPIPSNNCMPTSCSSGQILSPNCRCAYPYMGTLHFRSPSFSNLNDLSIYTSLQDSLMLFFNSQELPVDSVSLSYPTIDLNDYLLLNLQVFPSGQDRFNRTGLSSTGFMFSNQTFKPNDTYGPYYYIGSSYDFFSGESTHTNKSSSLGIIIGAAVGSSVLALLLLLAGVYAFRQKRRAEKADKQNHPFALWDTHKSNGDVPQLKGARCFSFDELKKCANNFSEVNDIGSGGYGKVYRGTLPSGTLVAIKRAQQGSMQGALEFKTEIELLSRVHHKNVVSLVGFCFDQGEQMLVYEYIPNGTIKDSLSGRSGIRLDWMRRLRIALGAARGLQYLHDLADPPIIHRDIKSTNILLDERLNAKVADFGLSKLMGDAEKGYVSTQVKGTMGYMDPEYYMTQQLTEKSDVYSFGIVMLELVTARSPIEKGKHIVREVREAMDKTKVLYNLYGFLDSDIGSSTEPRGFERFVDLAMRCVEEEGACRPTMSEVMKEIESIMELAGLNPNAESAPTSASYGGASKSFHHPYSDESLFVYSGVYPPSKLEPK